MRSPRGRDALAENDGQAGEARAFGPWRKLDLCARRRAARHDAPFTLARILLERTEARPSRRFGQSKTASARESLRCARFHQPTHPPRAFERHFIRGGGAL